LLVPYHDRWSELLGGQYAFLEAKFLSMDKAPDLDMIDLHPALRQLSNQSKERKVRGRAFQQPIATGTG
jgi:hypothetical protein